MDSTKKKDKRPKKRRKISADYLHNAGLYYLQRFSASRQQFRRVMLRKVRKSCLHHPEQDFEVCTALVEETVQKFERAGLLNDELYAQGAVASLRRQGKSKKEIFMKMKMRGLPAGLVQEKLESADSGNSHDAELVAAVKILRRKKAGPFGDKDHKKTLTALARAGFSYETAQAAIKMGKKEAEEILNL